MTCSYCGSRNSEMEHRCRRCGRRPGDTLNSEFTVHRTTGALATKPRLEPVINRQPMGRTMNSPHLATAVQGNLFNPNVIPISAPPEGARPNQRPRASASASSSAVKPPVRRKPRVAEGQGELELLATVASKPRTLGTSVDAVIYCEAPVATPMHRAVAAALDWSMVLIGYGLFLLTYYICGGGFDLNRTNVLVFGATLLVIGCTYGVVWTIAGTETAGMRWTHLKLITFDGFQPDARHRFMRFAGSCLSLFTIVGALWSLADEESLGWQDHISRTFPTAHELETRVFRRR